MLLPTLISSHRQQMLNIIRDKQFLCCDYKRFCLFFENLAPKRKKDYLRTGISKQQQIVNLTNEGAKKLDQ